ncbi:MAG: cytochrome c biogenesis CcdA family protein [Candidatus Bathyarchaeota archaeon]|nr:cytochrome c biogenesis CcdA family protein [Candidatus Bathyarchaeota archaeon]
MTLQLSGLAFAFSAGVFTLFSPCSYALLPGYISYYLGAKFGAVKALTGGLACTLGLITVFAAIGALASSLGELVPQIIPLLDIAAGVILIAMGLGNLLDLKTPFISLNIGPSKKQGLLGLYTYGIVYGLAGVGCSAPIFISVLFYSMSKGLAQGILTFIAYALGMGAPLIVTTLILSQTKDYMIQRINMATEKLRRASGAILVAVGLYLIYYYYATYL